jgi:hypothetical protein
MPSELKILKPPLAGKGAWKLSDRRRKSLGQAPGKPRRLEKAKKRLKSSINRLEAARPGPPPAGKRNAPAAKGGQPPGGRGKSG